MKGQHITAVGIAVASIFVVSAVLASQDRFTLKSPNGIAFSEFKGYDAWQVITPSQPDGGIKSIQGNPVMIKAYQDGFPANGKAVPDGAMIAKIEWSTKSNPLMPGFSKVPDTLRKLSFMLKDSKRFLDTDGWGYAEFAYDATSGAFKPFGDSPAFAKAKCHQCHIAGAKARDFVFTDYALNMSRTLTTQEENIMIQTSATQQKSARTADKKAIRPFQANVPEAELVELRRRIVATRLPDRETVTDFSQGVQLELIQELARYWATEYNWRRGEAQLNAHPQFITEIDGLDIHFIHVRSRHENAMPLIVTHGWPGSPIEQLKIIDPLTNPTAHGGSASDAFHLVIPSMAGYGFSGKPTSSGWDPARMARAWVELMKRLGYSRFAAQGGDWGAFVTNEMALLAPPELIGIHLNFTGTAPSDVAKALPGPAPAGLSAEEQRAYDQMAALYRRIPTQIMMASHPQTLYGLADSPVALAAWMIDHDPVSYGHIAKLFIEGEPYGDLTRDDILDNITLSWLTNTGMSSARIYVEYKGAFFNDLTISVPAAVSVFPEEVYQAPRSWTELAYTNLIHFNALAKGGHFAAWEQPKIFSEEVRAGLRSLRK